MLDLTALAGRRYRCALDPSASIDGQSREDRAWLVQIPARYGHIFIHGHFRLGAYTDRPRLLSKLLAIPGVKLHQAGDGEASVTFDPNRLDEVASVLQARRRRTLSPDQRQAAVDRLAPHRYPRTPASRQPATASR